MTVVNGHLALAADDNISPRPEGSLTSSVEDNNLLSSAIDPPPSSAPLATYEETDSATRRDSSHDALHEEKQPLVTSPSTPPNPLTKIGGKFSALLHNNKFEEAHNYLTALQRNKSHLQLNDIRDLKGRSLLEIVIASNYSDKKINLVEYLIKADCDINAIGSDGRVLLSIAVAMPEPDNKLIELLLKTDRIAANKRGEGSDANRRIAIEIVIHRLLGGEDLFELAQILIEAEANILFKSPMYNNRSLFSLLDDINDSEKRINLKYYIDKKNPLKSPFQILRIYFKDPEYFYALIEQAASSLAAFPAASFCLILGAVYLIGAPTYRARMKKPKVAILEKQLSNLSKFEETFLNPKESLLEAKTLKSNLGRIKKTISDKIHLSHSYDTYEPNSQETTSSCQQLVTPIKDHIKAHCLEKIKTTLGLPGSKSRRADQKESKSTKTLLQEKREVLEKSMSFQNQNSQEDLEETITIGKQLLNETNALIKNYISEEFQRLSADLGSLASRLQIHKNLDQLRTDITNKITELSTPISFPINFDDIKALITSSKTLLSDASKRIEQQDRAQARATKNAHEQALQKKRAPLLDTLKSTEAQLKHLDPAQADPIQTTISEYRQAILSIDDIDDQPTWDKYKTASEELLQETEKLAQAQQKKLPITHINNLLEKAKEILAKLKEEAGEAEEIEQFDSQPNSKETQTQTHPKEDKKSASPQKNFTNSVTPSTAGIFSSASRSTSSTITAQPISRPPPEPSQRDVLSALELIDKLKPIYKKSAASPGKTEVDNLFQRYLQRGCLFYSLQILLENLDDPVPYRDTLKTPRNRLVHKLPLTDKIFTEAGKTKLEIFLELANLLQPLQKKRKEKEGLYKSCEDVFSSKKFTESTINRFNLEPADSKEFPPTEKLTKETIKGLIDHFMEGRSLFETSGKDQDKSKLAYIASAFLVSEIDARIKDQRDMDENEKDNLYKQLEGWLQAELAKGRDHRHNATDLLKTVLQDTLNQPTQKKRKANLLNQMNRHQKHKGQRWAKKPQNLPLAARVIIGRGEKSFTLTGWA